MKIKRLASEFLCVINLSIENAQARGLKMNGAQLIVNAAAASGIEYCFANPGTTEIPLVAAMAKSRSGAARQARL